MILFGIMVALVVLMVVLSNGVERFYPGDYSGNLTIRMIEEPEKKKYARVMKNGLYMYINDFSPSIECANPRFGVCPFGYENKGLGIDRCYQC